MRLKDFCIIVLLAALLCFYPVKDLQLETSSYTASIQSLYQGKEDILYYDMLNRYQTTQQAIYFIVSASAYSSADPNCQDYITIPKYSTATLTATNLLLRWQISYNGNTYYVDSSCFTTSLEEFNEVKAQTYNTNWQGTKLNRVLGRIQGPSGQETYYNLNMSGVIEIMRRMGNTDLYWVRDDGVKMLGDYVMVAADLTLHPRGSLVECSLGMGIVCDTGAFVNKNPTQLDIAVNW